MYTRRLSLASLALFVLCLSSAPAVKADEIAIWNFNDGNLIVDRGQGTLTTTSNPANIMFLSGTTFNASMGDPAGLALAILAGPNLENNGVILEVHVSTLGFQNVHVSWGWQRSDTGFNDDVVRESMDGITFSGFSFAAIQTGFFGGLDSSGAGSLFNNNPNFAFRITLTGATSEIGNIRFDNILVTGTPQTVPEPATMVLLTMGLAGAAAEVRRRRRARR